MTEIRPILDDEPTPAERLLIGSTVLDRPPPGGKERALAALGLGVSVGAVATSAAASSATSALVIAKWVATGALGGFVVATSVAVVGHQVTRTHAPAPVSVASAPRPATPVPPRLPVAAAEIADAPVPPAREATHRDAPARAERRPDLPPAIEGPRTLSAELAILDRARRALAAADPALSLRLLDRHDEEFVTPNLSQETAMLRVDALHALGRDAEAADIANRLLAANPNSAYAKRLRSLLALPRR